MSLTTTPDEDLSLVYPPSEQAIAEEAMEFEAEFAIEYAEKHGTPAQVAAAKAEYAALRASLSGQAA